MSKTIMHKFLLILFCLLSFKAYAVDNRQVNTKELNILCSFHPIYVFAQNIVLGVNNVKLDCLLPANVGPHDYALTPNDMKRIAQADLLLINGLGLEEFISNAIKTANPRLKVVETSKGIKPIPTRGAEDDDSESEHKEHEAHHHGKYNPHTWVSPKSAIIQIRNIQKALSDIDPANAEKYKANSEKYISKLQKLVNDFTQLSKTVKNRRFVTFHDAFDYFARDFNYEVVDVIEVVAGQEPSAGELSKMAQRIKTLKAKAIFSEPQFSEKTAIVLSKETGIPVYQLDPVATGDSKPDAYEKVMRKNLETLKKALSE
ncbi:MAG: metal ABC transporter substrate-binding protein [bacterium]